MRNEIFVKNLLENGLLEDQRRTGAIILRYVLGIDDVRWV
jgi:hypothetical protein